MNVLSLFDGISGAMLAMKDLGIKIDNYYASEIDKFCIEVSKNKFPDIIHLGDVKKIQPKDLPKIDLLIGGSPCQDLSGAFKGRGLEGSRSSLFFDFVKLRDKLKPKFFLLENVKNKWKTEIDNYIGVEGKIINSQLFTAQFRPRCYWSNIPIEIPTKISEDSIVDIMEKGKIDDRYFFDQRLLNGIKIKVNKKRKDGIDKIYDIPRLLLNDNERQRRLYSVYGKSPTLLARSDTPKIFINNSIRKLTPLECERLQGIEDNHTAILSNTQRYKAVGNSFTVPVIRHILSGIK